MTNSAPEEQNDSVLIEVACFVAHGSSLPEAVQQGAIQIKEVPGGTFVRLLSRKVEPEGWEARGREFDVVINEATALIRQIGSAGPSFATSGITTSVDIAFVPDKGDAGVSIPSSVLSEWGEAGVNLLLSAWPGQTWFDARFPG